MYVRPSGHCCCRCCCCCCLGILSTHIATVWYKIFGCPRSIAIYSYSCYRAPHKQEYSSTVSSYSTTRRDRFPLELISLSLSFLVLVSIGGEGEGSRRSYIAACICMHVCITQVAVVVGVAAAAVSACFRLSGIQDLWGQGTNETF